MAEQLYWLQHAPIPRRYNEIVGAGTDRPLDEVGVKKATIMADQLYRVLGDCILTDVTEIIVTSPLRRAMMTSEIIADKLDFDIEVDEQLRAQHFGALEARTIEEVSMDDRLSPYLYRNLSPDEQFARRAPNGGESIKDTWTRMMIVRDRLKAVFPKTPFVVTHGSVLNTLIGFRQGLKPHEWDGLSSRFKDMIVDDAPMHITSVDLVPRMEEQAQA